MAPSYAQLQAEAWWGREIVTPELTWLGDELCRRTGRPRDAFGDKGNNVHLNGAHRSQEWIQRSRFCTSRTYTVQSGLTAEQERHVAGVDFTPGTTEAMIAQSRRLLAAMKAGLLDEVLAIYCNVDGDQVVDGWDNVRNRAATSDSSHLWHWHLTLDRRHCADRQLMERIVAIALGEPLEALMALSDQQQQDLWEWVALLVDPSTPAGGRPGDRFRFPPTVMQIKGGVDALVAAAAADEARDQATLAAVRALAIASGLDPAPILDAIAAVRDDTHAGFVALQQQLADVQARNARLTAALAAAGGALDGADDPVTSS